MEQQTFDLTSAAKKTGPVTCLGMTFPDEAARRAHFTALLAEKLKDPEFRKIEGFPLGTDEDILALSDPPYYCACPNPWINDFLKEWEAAKPPKPMGYKYEREPFAADVSEGKNDPIYNAHSYHTKVPHKAIMRYILHYTEPGDIVFDGFCGTGMTGVAAQLCGDIEQVRSLGYKVDEKTGAITDPNAEDPQKVISHLGARKAVLNDLSPAATYISYNYNSPHRLDEIYNGCKKIANVANDNAWMYATKHRDGSMGRINYTIWSDVVRCPACANEFSFWDVAVDQGDESIKDSFECPKCGCSHSKNSVEKVFTSIHDSVTGEIVSIAKAVPVQISYSVGKKRFVKKPDAYDLEILSRIESTNLPMDYSPSLLPIGENTRQPLTSHGIKYVHQFYTRRALFSMLSIAGIKDRESDWCNHAAMMVNSYMNRWPRQRGPLNGTLYIGAIKYENNVFKVCENKGFPVELVGRNVVETSSMSAKTMADNSLDYIFLDPPFGANINYSQLNHIWESWYGVYTNIKPEAIKNDAQKKGISDYRGLMEQCFRKAYRLLRPGRWMTIEFSNTSAEIWNSIQTALSDAGFIVSTVSALDKKQGSFKAQTTPTAVKQDLVITAYKPDANFEARFKLESETEDGVWDFVRTHLSKLPVCKVKSGKLITIPERDPRILFDQVVSYYVRKNLNVPISSRDFQEGLAVRYSQRDGMFFLPEQAAEYDKKKALQKYEVDEGAALFIHDEASAISWLRSVLGKKPQTYSSVQPQYLQAPTSISKHEELPDLRELLKDNFLCYDAAKDGDVPSQIHTLLSTNYHELRNLPKDNPQLKEKADGMWYVPDPNKASDLEKLREKSPLKEFEAYRAEKKLKKFRLEVVRAGFKKAFADKDFATILGVGAKIPEDVINEDDKLLMWYNIAQRLGGR